MWWRDRAAGVWNRKLHDKYLRKTNHRAAVWWSAGTDLWPLSRGSFGLCRTWCTGKLRRRVSITSVLFLSRLEIMDPGTPPIGRRIRAQVQSAKNSA